MAYQGVFRYVLHPRPLFHESFPGNGPGIRQFRGRRNGMAPAGLDFPPLARLRRGEGPPARRTWEKEVGAVCPHLFPVAHLASPHEGGAVAVGAGKGHSAFLGCSSLVEIEFPSSLDEIASVAFRECHSLKSVRFNRRLRSIGGQAFLYCENLKVAARFAGHTLPEATDQNYIRFQKEELLHHYLKVIKYLSFDEEVKITEITSEDIREFNEMKQKIIEKDSELKAELASLRRQQEELKKKYDDLDLDSFI